ncbi:flavin reductase family protein [Amycolatopsis alkalitolerans]|uniref:Flavin reductase family protein n=1 Tax=Amycolatopsis alkalitolerans TaxID=2547244 RepID=A0A5C4M8F4_9PSEU|nr:flavin reductase family protein [Amycolatopsis alkalitolerans]TNC28053.1 flavin reductase family protein [Amycolatopsis alkalitolerans]
MSGISVLAAQHTIGDPVDDASMRHVMGAFPSGVTVLTTCAGEHPVGMTISSFASVSIDPPLLLQCVSRSAGCLPAYRIGRPVVVNVLACDQAGLARRFAGRHEDRFAGVAFGFEAGGAPVLDRTAAWAGGTVDRIYDAGDHVILLIRVREVRRSDRKPLLYHSGRMYDWTTATAAIDT